MYSVLWSKAASKEVRKIPHEYRLAIMQKAELLDETPRPAWCIKLKGNHDLYRFRQGGYRAIYAVHDKTVQIIVFEIGHRKDVYQGY